MIDALPAKQMYLLFYDNEKPPITPTWDLEKLYHIKHSGRPDTYITHSYRVNTRLHEMESAGFVLYYPEYHDKYVTGSVINRVHDEQLQLMIDMRNGVCQLNLT